MMFRRGTRSKGGSNATCWEMFAMTRPIPAMRRTTGVPGVSANSSPVIVSNSANNSSEPDASAASHGSMSS